MQKNFENYFTEALHEAKIRELIDRFSQKGFKQRQSVDANDQQFDLILDNPETNQTIVFEVKTLPVDAQVFDTIEQLRTNAKELGYEFRLVTISRPTEYSIEIDWLDNAILDYIIHEDQPSDITEKATHVYCEGVSTDIEAIEIRDNIATVRANGSISVELQYGSDSDQRNDMGLIIPTDFFFEGNFTLNVADKSIIEASIKIDNSGWSELFE